MFTSCPLAYDVPALTEFTGAMAVETTLPFWRGGEAVAGAMSMSRQKIPATTKIPITETALHDLCQMVMLFAPWNNNYCRTTAKMRASMWDERAGHGIPNVTHISLHRRDRVTPWSISDRTSRNLPMSNRDARESAPTGLQVSRLPDDPDPLIWKSAGEVLAAALPPAPHRPSRCKRRSSR
jgi:hypothetical protein